MGPVPARMQGIKPDAVFSFHASISHTGTMLCSFFIFWGIQKVGMQMRPHILSFWRRAGSIEMVFTCEKR